MAAKLALIFVVAVLLFQVFSMQTGATVMRRESPVVNSGEPSNDLESMLNSAKHSFDELLDKVKSSNLYQNATKAIEEFGKKIKDTGDEFYTKLTNNTHIKTRK
ncbi:uncharacterized protein [Euwallacea fornicatus]|uniref:uncharacterized protein n=1 Tax=Euwallacea fornicatus TaxID=995702 RepID=UPI00338DB55E